jgi:rubredoxin
MATATLDSPAAPPVSEAPPRQGEYRCECGHVLRVFGGGRHRVYFEPGNASWDEPVMNRVCPQCGSGLPGKNTPS